MFILYALIIGLGLGLLLRGRPQRLGTLSFRLAWLMASGLAVQLALFASPISDRIGDLGPAIYVISTALVWFAVAANVAMPGMPIVVVGAASNLYAILANGGYMPADPGALASVGHVLGQTYSNSAVFQHVELQPLTDIFALPRWVPFYNVFSIGDVLISLGVVWLIVATMRRADNVSAASAEAPNAGRAEMPAASRGERLREGQPGI